MIPNVVIPEENMVTLERNFAVTPSIEGMLIIEKAIGRKTIKTTSTNADRDKAPEVLQRKCVKL